MGQLAWISIYLLIALPIDVNDNRRHVHVFVKGKRSQKSVAKFWIESNGEKCIEIAYSSLTSRDNEMLISAIDRNWEYINKQISSVFEGKKTVANKLK